MREVGDAAVEQRRDEESGDEQQDAEAEKRAAGLRLQRAVEQIEIDDEAESRRQKDERDRRTGEYVDEVLDESPSSSPLHRPGDAAVFSHAPEVDGHQESGRQRDRHAVQDVEAQQRRRRRSTARR